MSTRHVKLVVLMVGVTLLFHPSTAQAYVGPGGVITAIGAALALLAAIVASIFGFVWYPIKRLLAFLRGRGPEDDETPAATDN